MLSKMGAHEVVAVWRILFRPWSWNLVGPSQDVTGFWLILISITASQSLSWLLSGRLRQCRRLWVPRPSRPGETAAGSPSESATGTRPVRFSKASASRALFLGTVFMHLELVILSVYCAVKAHSLNSYFPLAHSDFVPGLRGGKIVTNWVWS
ncbi:hypothetical protein VTK56DRAFT_7021 [Thermocarpiscus australiensis]